MHLRLLLDGGLPTDRTALLDAADGGAHSSLCLAPLFRPALPPFFLIACFACFLIHPSPLRVLSFSSLVHVVRFLLRAVKAPLMVDGSMMPQYTLFAGASNLAAGLAGGFSGLAAGGISLSLSLSLIPVKLDGVSLASAPFLDWVPSNVSYVKRRTARPELPAFEQVWQLVLWGTSALERWVSNRSCSWG